MKKFLEKIKNPEFVDLEDESSEFCNEYENASIFLHGSCNLFSLALHQEFGYDAFEIQKGASCHCFCQTTYKGVPVYIDVRGATTSCEEFLAGTYANLYGHDEPVPQNIEEDAKLSHPYDTDGLAFAKYLIHKNPKDYNITEL